VALGSAPRIGVAQVPGGAQVCPSATWHIGHSKGPDYLGSEAGPDCLGCGVICQLNGSGVTQFYGVLIKDFKYFYYN